MKKSAKKILSMITALSLTMSLVSIGVSADEETGKVFSFATADFGQADFINPQFAIYNGPVWIGNYNQAIGAYAKFKPQNINTDYVKQVKLKYRSYDNYLDKWTYSSDANYKTYIDAISSNWESGKAWDKTDFIKASDIAGVTVTDKTTYGEFEADVTEDFKTRGLDENGAISYSVYEKASDTPDFYIVKGEYFSLETEYYNNAELCEIINSKESKEDFMKFFDGGLIESDKYDAYLSLNNKSSIADALFNGKPYASMAALKTAFETAYDSYAANPSYEDEAGNVVSAEKSDYLNIDRLNKAQNSGYASMGFYTVPGTSTVGVTNVLLKFDISKINKKFIKKVTLKYDILPQFSTWYTYDSSLPYTTKIDSAEPAWSSEKDYSVNFPSNYKPVKESIAETKKIDKGTYATLYADVTKDFKERAAGNDAVSYGLNKIEDVNGKYVVTKDCSYRLEIEYMNEYEMCQVINNAQNADEVQDVIVSGALGNDDIYTNYGKLNNKSVINEALLEGRPYSNAADVRVALETAYDNYIKNPSYEDEAGENVTIEHTAYAYADRSWHGAENPYADLSDGYSFLGRYNKGGQKTGANETLLKFNVNGIDRDYIKSAKLVYQTVDKDRYSGSTLDYVYNPNGDYTTYVDEISSAWTNTSKYADTFGNDEFNSSIKENVSTAYASFGERYATLTADITDSIKTRAAEDGNISYRLRKNALDNSGSDTVNSYLIDSNCPYSIEIQYINDYEMYRKYTEIKDDKIKFASFLAQLGKIKNIRFNESIAVSEMFGKDYDNLDAIAAALRSVGSILITSSDITTNVTDTEINGSFKLNSFIEGDETTEIKVIVASYTSDKEMIESYICDDVTEIDQMSNGTPGEADVTYKLTKNLDKVDNIRLFVWDSFVGMKAFTGAETLYSKNN